MDDKMTNAYNERMLEAFVAKPEKMAWYRDLYDRCYADGFLVFKWKWSWWAFLSCGFWFLLYRKIYAPAAAFFIAFMLANLVELGFVVAAIAGGSATSFVIERYLKIKAQIESAYNDETKRIEAMRLSGGYNNWALWACLILCTLFIAFIALFVGLSAIDDWH